LALLLGVVSSRQLIVCWSRWLVSTVTNGRVVGKTG
jgi:hypothetical protein